MNLGRSEESDRSKSTLLIHVAVNLAVSELTVTIYLFNLLSSDVLDSTQPLRIPLNANRPAQSLIQALGTQRRRRNYVRTHASLQHDLQRAPHNSQIIPEPGGVAGVGRWTPVPKNAPKYHHSD